MNHAALRELENGKFTPRLDTAIKIVLAVIDTIKAREEMLRLHLGRPCSGCLAEQLIAEALRRGGLKVLEATRPSREISFDLIVEGGTCQIGIIIKVIKRE